MPPDEANLIRRIADYERISGILWILLGIVQTIAILTAIAGIWNIFAGVSRLKASKRVLACDQDLPAEYESITQLVIIGILNLLLGGFIGLVFVGFDFYIRDLVLTHRDLFAGSSSAANPQAIGVEGLAVLEQLGRLKDNGVLSEPEFLREKAKIFGAEAG